MPVTDSISLRFEYLVPVLVETKTGKKASGYELKRFVRAHRCGADDFGCLFGHDANKLIEMFRESFEKNLQAEYGDWKVQFRGACIMRHPWGETPTANDPRWV